MGYTWEAWSLDPDDLLAELRRPRLSSGELRMDAQDSVMAEVLRRAPVLAGEVAGALAAGGGDLVAEHAAYVIAVTRTLGRFATSAWHTSGGGEWFRDDLFGRQVAAVVGRQTAVHAVVRELGGLTMVSLPMLGWLDAAECRDAAERVRGADVEQVLGEEPSEDLWQVFDAFGRAATWGTGLVTVYG